MHISTVTASQQMQAVSIGEWAILRVENSIITEFVTSKSLEFTEWQIEDAENITIYIAINLQTGEFSDFPLGKL